MIRPKACALGGTSVSLIQSMNSQTSIGMGASGAIQFAVLRPKTSTPATPTKF